MRVKGRAWVFGDAINTDLLAPGYAMTLPPKELAQHCLEAANPDFAREVRPGDVVVAGDNFGLGSSREQAAISLHTLGVGAVLARSFARIFYRNAINIGLPALSFDAVDEIADGAALDLDLAEGWLKRGGDTFALKPLPPHIRDLIAAGGLMAQLHEKMAKQRQAEGSDA
ncbi:MAG: 3-isopropylmalate dehydratase [Pseudomonadota bacterium]